jgi:RHS repeat-associated protein
MSDTSHRQDTAGGLYDFPLREYGIQGRWPSPDPAGVSATCTKNPQTQNRYAYVTNNPLSYVDPLGTQGGPCWGEPCGGGGGCAPGDPSCCAPGDPSCCQPGDPSCCDPCNDPFCPLPLPPGGCGGGGGDRPPLFFGPEPDKHCEIVILRPGMNGVNQFDWCADNRMKLIWLADCRGDKDCCITKLEGYRKPCEDQRYVYHVQIAAQLYGGWCCRDNR